MQLIWVKHVNHRILIALFVFVSFSCKAVEPNAPGNLGIEVTMADTLQYIQRWISTPKEAPAPLPRLSSLKPGQIGYVAFVVSGLSKDANGNYRYSVSWKLFGPDGSLLHEEKNYAKGAGR